MSVEMITFTCPADFGILHASRIVLISPDNEGVKDWQIDFLTNAHNGDNPAEVERIRAEHPGEDECVLNGRVLGTLAPTRCE